MSVKSTLFADFGDEGPCAQTSGADLVRPRPSAVTGRTDEEEVVNERRQLDAE
jgi:hypothetical protein